MNKKICVVGAGRWGKNHIKTLHELGFLAGIVEADSDTRNMFKEKYPGVKTFATVRDAIKEDFDGFTVATPAETHFKIAEFIITRKKHVLVEKPLTLKASEARRLKELAEENNVNLMVGHLLLFHPAIRKIKELIEKGKIGKLEYIYSNRLNLGTVRTEENILWSFAPHDISIFQYFIGSLPIEVISRGGAFLQPHIHDSSMTVLTYPDNIVGHIYVSWLHPFKEHRMVVIGSKGMFSYEDSSDDKNILFYEKGIDWIQGEPIKRDGPTEIIPYEKKMPLTEELKYFAKHTNGDPVKTADAQNGAEVLEILEKASESLLTGGRGLEVGGRTSEIRSQKPGFFAHHSVEIDEKTTIGSGTKIWHFSHILSGSRIGENCNIGQNVVIGPDVTIGKQCKIQNNVSVYKGVTLEDGIFCGPSMVFTNIYNPRAEIRKMDQVRPTLVKKGTTIGANATIVCGVTLGRYSFIGAGTVVTKDVPDHALVVGNSAKQIGWVCGCGERLTDNLECSSCGKSYRECDSGIKEYFSQS
ncbi:MAG: Gfo/Idh/MocA family oxidoreductase [Deltaproteobacteria bacterium]|nr:Gfo/Idh/MocA family oxidoreductase [Deltaproteobacteria bacterium]MBW2647247.1 Gfo/Idh/MocA family oxidoreductase [Deltaproteobacteria bacterium]